MPRKWRKGLLKDVWAQTPAMGWGGRVVLGYSKGCFIIKWPFLPPSPCLQSYKRQITAQVSCKGFIALERWKGAHDATGEWLCEVICGKPTLMRTWLNLIQNRDSKIISHMKLRTEEASKTKLIWKCHAPLHGGWGQLISVGRVKSSKGNLGT